MNIFTKHLTVPSSNDTRQAEVAQLWEVRWKSRHGEFSHDVQPEMECFLSEKEALKFKEALTDAFKLIRHTSGNWVDMRRAK